MGSSGECPGFGAGDAGADTAASENPGASGCCGVAWYEVQSECDNTHQTKGQKYNSLLNMLVSAQVMHVFP